jgi:hypothetical protein
MTAPSANRFGDAQQRDELVLAELVPHALPDPGEKITILRLMVWTAGSAVVLALHRQLAALPNNPDNSEPWLRTLDTLIPSTVQGAAIASLLLVVGRLFNKGPKFPRQPAHWLLVISGIYAVASLFGYLVLYESFRQDPWMYIIYYRLPMLGLATVLIIFALTQMPVRADWLLVCLAWLASFFVLIVVACARLAPELREAAAILEACIAMTANALFVIPVLVDHALGVKRDHLHFVGIAVRLGLAALQVISILKVVLQL